MNLRNDLRKLVFKVRVYLGLEADPRAPEEDWRISKHAEGKCKEVAQKFGYNRVTVIHRHNGGKWKSGKSIQKLSAHYNHTEIGVDIKSKTVKNTNPIGEWTDLLTEMYGLGFSYESNVDESPNVRWRELLKGEEVTSYFVCFIRDADKRELGLFLCETVGENGVELTSDDMRLIQHTALWIGQYIKKKYTGGGAHPPFLIEEM